MKPGDILIGSRKFHQQYAFCYLIFVKFCRCFPFIFLNCGRMGNQYSVFIGSSKGEGRFYNFQSTFDITK